MMFRFIERARGGDQSAIVIVVEHLRPRLSRMAAHYARCSGQDTDDLLQEGWLGLLESLPELDLRIGSPEQYLIQRARWRMLDAIKYAHRRRCTSLEEQSPGVTPHLAIESPLDAASVSEFAEQLTTTQRAILVCLLEGLTWREAGDALGCTSANVAYHVRRIRERYRRWFADAA